MNKHQDLKERFYEFALAIVKLVRSLPRETAGIEIGRQVLKSGTSVAAHYEEAASGFSKADFIYKVSVSFKEAKESNLWLRLLKDSGLARESQVSFLIQESFEIASILAKSLKTAKANSRD